MFHFCTRVVEVNVLLEYACSLFDASGSFDKHPAEHRNPFGEDDCLRVEVLAVRAGGESKIGSFVGCGLRYRLLYCGGECPLVCWVQQRRLASVQCFGENLRANNVGLILEGNGEAANLPH